MLNLAAGLFVNTQLESGLLTAEIRVKNVGPGHALPTGEPMRSMVMLVQAECDGEPLQATGGDTVPAFAGYLQRKTQADDWTQWEGAKTGQVISVVEHTGAFHDYNGPGRFGDGGFSATEKGLPVTSFVGFARITAVDGAVITTDPPVPAGDVAYLLPDTAWPEEGAPIGRYAGRPGMAFARVLTDRNQQQMVPHFVAEDVVIDNRLRPQESWTSTHTFQAPCSDPTVSARLMYRPYPPAINEERQWAGTETLMTEASR